MFICGQKKFIEIIDDLVSRDKFPRFSIIVGNAGFGKKVISEYIANKLGATFYPCEISVDSVRNTISSSYANTQKSLYMFFDCDDMSAASKNALLKVTEEPPNNAYFIMTVRDISNILPTLISRGTVFNMNLYTINDIDSFIEYKGYGFDKKTKQIVYQICTCPKDVIIASQVDIKAVYDLADKFIQYIGQVSIANELKMTTQLQIKKDDESKIDPVLFMRCIMMCCNNYVIDNCSNNDLIDFKNIITETSKALIELSAKGSNKQMVIDNWIINTHIKLSSGGR